MRTVLMALLLLSVPFVAAQEESDAETSLPPGVTVVLDYPAVDKGLQVAKEVFIDDSHLTAEIPRDGATAALRTAVASRVNAHVTVRTNHEDLMVASGESLLRLRAGGRMSVSFTAFSPHSGTVEFLNSEGEVIGSVDYTVTNKTPYRQSVSGSVNTRGDSSLTYSMRFDGGFGFSAGVDVDSEDGDLRGSLRGSYSW